MSELIQPIHRVDVVITIIGYDQNDQKLVSLTHTFPSLVTKVDAIPSKKERLVNKMATMLGQVADEAMDLLRQSWPAILRGRRKHYERHGDARALAE